MGPSFGLLEDAGTCLEDAGTCLRILVKRSSMEQSSDPFHSPLLACVVRTSERHIALSPCWPTVCASRSTQISQLITVPAEQPLYQHIQVGTSLFFYPSRDGKGERWVSIQCTLGLAVADPQQSSDTVAWLLQPRVVRLVQQLRASVLKASAVCIQGPRPESPAIPVWGVISKLLGDHCGLERDFCHGAGFLLPRACLRSVEWNNLMRICSSTKLKASRCSWMDTTGSAEAEPVLVGCSHVF